MTATPHLLETYEEARLLWGAKGWVLTKVADDLSEKSELKRFNLSHPMLSRKTKPGSNCSLEPEVAAAVENLKTWPGYERQAEITTKGLLALHGIPSPKEMDQLEEEMRERLPGEIARTLIDALEEKAGARESKLIDALEEKAGARESKLLQAVGRLGHLARRYVAISAGMGAMVGCLILVPLIVAAARPPAVVIVAPGGPDTSPRLLLSEWGEKMPPDQTVPFRTLPGQKVAPCDAERAQKEINGNCWIAVLVKPPCPPGIFRHGDVCYMGVAAARPAESGPDR